MDERKLAELFRDAVDDVPPASFNEHDIVTASQRARARARAAVLTSATLAAVFLAGGAAVGVSLWGGTETPADVPAAAGAPVPGSQEDNAARPLEADERGAQPPHDRTFKPQMDVPKESSEQGDGSSGKTGPSANGCGQADGKLANALAGELPSAVRVGAPTGASFSCHPGMRAASYEVDDGVAHGRVTVLLVPKQQQSDTAAVTWPQGSVTHHATAASGDIIVLVSEPTEGSPEAPLWQELARISTAVASRL